MISDGSCWLCAALQRNSLTQSFVQATSIRPVLMCCLFALVPPADVRHRLRDLVKVQRAFNLCLAPLLLKDLTSCSFLFAISSATTASSSCLDRWRQEIRCVSRATALAHTKCVAFVSRALSPDRSVMRKQDYRRCRKHLDNLRSHSERISPDVTSCCLIYLSFRQGQKNPKTDG